MKKIVIVCVDDEKIILNSLKAQLKENYGDQFIYETAENATDALEIIDELMKDLDTQIIIICDYLMPIIKGDEFLITVHKKYPLAIKILLTGQANDKAIENSIRFANLHKYIRKPWLKTELLSTIDSAVLLLN